MSAYRGIRCVGIITMSIGESNLATPNGAAADPALAVVGVGNGVISPEDDRLCDERGKVRLANWPQGELGRAGSPDSVVGLDGLVRWPDRIVDPSNDVGGVKLTLVTVLLRLWLRLAAPITTDSSLGDALLSENVRSLGGNGGGAAVSDIGLESFDDIGELFCPSKSSVDRLRGLVGDTSGENAARGRAPTSVRSGGRRGTRPSLSLLFEASVVRRLAITSQTTALQLTKVASSCAPSVSNAAPTPALVGFSSTRCAKALLSAISCGKKVRSEARCGGRGPTNCFEPPLGDKLLVLNRLPEDFRLTVADETAVRGLTDLTTARRLDRCLA